MHLGLQCVLFEGVGVNVCVEEMVFLARQQSLCLSLDEDDSIVWPPAMTSNDDAWRRTCIRMVCALLQIASWNWKVEKTELYSEIEDLILCWPGTTL